MKTKKFDPKRNAKWKGLSGVILILIGIILELTGQGNFQIGQLYINSWIFTIGIIAILIAIKSYFFGKEIIYDERTQLIILKSTKATLSATIYLLLAIMIATLIKPIEISLSTISVVILFFIIFVYRISYWKFNKKY